MASFITPIVTNWGSNAISTAIASGYPLELVAVKIGAGYPTGIQDAHNFTDLVTYKMPATITSVNASVTYQDTVRANILSSNAPSAFSFNEAGVYASLNSGSPTLYAYSYVAGGGGDTIDPSISKLSDFVFPIRYSTPNPSGLITYITVTPQVDLHATTHLDNGVDPISVATSARSGVVPSSPNDASQALLGTNPVSWGNPHPVGAIIDFAGSNAPAGWLTCNGSSYSTSTYPNLYAVIGHTFGGSGSSFNVPDLRGRVSVGTGQGTGLTNRVLGATGGEETHVLTVTEMPSHTHTVTDPGHAHSVYDPTHAHSIYDAGHSHGVYFANWLADGMQIVQEPEGYSEVCYDSPPVQATAPTTTVGTGIGIYGAYTGIAIYSHVTGVTNQSTGGGAAHNNMSPFLVLAKIIKHD